MNYTELLILLPCHSLEDFPLHHEGEEADGLLAAWTSLWHPALIAGAGKMPSWRRADDPPAELAERLIVAPQVSGNQFATGFAQRAKQEAGCFVRNAVTREEIVEKALDKLEPAARQIDAELVADFFALGYCYLQVELLTRQRRYSSNLDQAHFQTQLVAAATAAAQGNADEARQKLASCYDLLADERNHYYPVDAFVLDLTMLAPTTLGEMLRTELQGGWPVNLLLSGELLRQMAQQEPESLAAVKQGLNEGRVGLIGGEEVEWPLPLLSQESLLASLLRGRGTSQELLGRGIEVFGRRRFGMIPALPQILQKLAYLGAVHSTFEDGKFPEGSQSKVRWEGSGGAAIDCLARPPLDAAKSQTFLGFALKMGESMDMDHVATLTLAHWPGRVSTWLRDLRRVARHTGALGKLITIEEYFRSTDYPGHLDRFEVDQYRSPYLKQSIIRGERDPISSVMRHWRRRTLLDAARGLSFLTSCVSAKPLDAGLLLLPDEFALVEAASTEMPQPPGIEFDSNLQGAVHSVAERLAAIMPRGPGGDQTGVLVFNPFSYVRRTLVESPRLTMPPEPTRPVYASGQDQAGTHAIVDVPPMGFVWIGNPSRRGDKKPPVPLAEEFVLRNEFFEAYINPETGALQALREYDKRGNRLSQQLALRVPGAPGKTGDAWRDPDEAAAYTSMQVDSLRVTRSTAALGEIAAQGRLVDGQGHVVATWQQTYRAIRGSRVLELEVELDPKEEPSADPWNAYYACRFAWNDESARLFRAVNQSRHAATAKRLEAPLYVEIETAEHGTTILTGGLPFHRRVGLRMLDTLLIVRGESQRRFKLGIGIDLSHPLHEAASLMAPLPLVEHRGSPPKNASSWLFHLDQKNVVVTAWEPLMEGAAAVGFRARILETEGRAANLKLSAFRPLLSARRLDFGGLQTGDCPVEEGKAHVEMGPGEWVQIEARWLEPKA